MGNIVAIFEYNHKKYTIKVIEEKKIGFFKIDDLGNLDDKLTLEERNVLNRVYKSLQVNLESSVFYSTKQIGNNNYNIYYDNSTHNYFWIPINKIYNSDDNIKLNFKYNHEPNIIYNTDNRKSSSNINSMFNKIVKIGKRYILVFVSATIILSSLSGCSVADNKIVNDSEITIDTQIKNTNTNPTIVESVTSPEQVEIEQSTIKESQKTTEEYNYEDIRNIIQSNNNLTEEEKEFLNKLQIVFDEYNEYMDLELIKERLQTLDIEYQESSTAFSSVEGVYIVNENKIIIKKATCFRDAKLNVLLHEFLHVLQSGRYIHFTNELSNEFFTREILFRLYNEGILLKEDFLNKTKTEDENSNINDDNELLKEILGQENFVSGYMYHMSVYYILAEILPKEVLCSYQFNPEKIQILKDALKNIDGLSNNEEVERVNSLIDHINDFREIDIKTHEYVYSYPEEEIFNELNYFYKKAKGRNIKEDFLINLRMTNYEIFSIFHFDIYNTKYYEDIINNLTLFLKENKGLDYLSSASLIDKTILSNNQKSAIIMGFLNSGEPISIIIDDELQQEYVSYLEHIESLEHSTRK